MEWYARLVRQLFYGRNSRMVKDSDIPIGTPVIMGINGPVVQIPITKEEAQAYEQEIKIQKHFNSSLRNEINELKKEINTLKEHLTTEYKLELVLKRIEELENEDYDYDDYEEEE